MINKHTARLVLALFASVFVFAHAQAQVPDSLDYQGYLTDAAGQPLDTAVAVTFSLYAAESGGTALWTDTEVVVPEQGLFTVTLGDGGVAFPVNLFNTPLWLGIEIDADGEMTPRRALTTAPYAQRAADAQLLGGLTPSSYDQASEVTALATDVATAQSGVNAVASDVATAQADIGQLQSDVSTAGADIGQLQSDLTGVQGDLTAVENTLPTLQTRVSSSCTAGSSIRAIAANGNVTCELDDASQWGLFNSNLYYTAGSIGVGTSAPAAAVQIDAPLGTDPFRARVQSATKLRVHGNGSVSVGTSSAGPDDGLYVLGDARIGAGTSAARLTVSDDLWQSALENTDVGGDDWYLGSSATGWAIGGGKFVISPTDSSSNAAVVIDSNKDVGIGATDPLTRLHLAGGTDVTATGGGYLTIGGITGANIALDSNEIMARSNGAVAPLTLNAEGGEVRINTNGSRDDDALEVRGRAYFDNGGNGGMRFTATNSNPTNALLESTQFEEGLLGQSIRPFWRVYSREFYALNSFEYRTYSDRSLKDNVRPIPDALATIKALEGVTYELRKHPMDDRDRVLSAEQEYDRRHQLGFIAQDVEKVLPQMVSLDESSGLKTVGYMGVVPVLVEAIKDQQKIIDEQNDRLDRQAAQIAELFRLLN